MIAALAVAGCKTGGTSPSLSWWPGSGKDANAKLASAPGYDDAVKKPSETQSPYPTTSTPESYALDGTKAPAVPGPSAPPVAPAMVAASPSGPITYGSSPPPAASPAAVASQVGPYQGWPAASGPATPTAPPAAPEAQATVAQQFTQPTVPPASMSQPAAASSFSTPSAPSIPASPPERYADARFADPAAMPAGEAASAAASRYGAGEAASAAASRYGTGEASQFGSSFGGPASSFPPPSASAEEPAAAGGQPAASVLPTTPPPVPATPPARRPDPGYRPGGTSTYRPSQAIIDEPAGGSGVRQASFESSSR